MSDRWKYFLSLIVGAVIFFIVPGSDLVLQEANGEPARAQVQTISPSRSTRSSRGLPTMRVGEARPIDPAGRGEGVQRAAQPTMSEPVPIDPNKRRGERPIAVALPMDLTPEEIYDYIQVLKYGETLEDRAYAAKVLGSGTRNYRRTNDPLIDDVYNALVTAFRENTDETLVADIAWAFGGLGKYQAGELLVNYLVNNTNKTVKNSVILSLGRLRYREAVNNLIQILLYNSDSELRGRAADALGMIGDNSAEYALIQALNEQDHFIKKQAIEALGKIGSSKAKYLLLNILNRDNDLALREEAARALQGLEARGVQ